MDSKQIDPEHAKLFEQMFGAESKGQNVDIMDPKLKTKLNEMTSPIPIKLCESFFKLLLTIFTKVIPISVMSSIVLSRVLCTPEYFDTFSSTFRAMFKIIIPAVWYMVIIAAIFWFALQTLNYLVQFIIVKYYDYKLKKCIDEYTKLHAAIANNLKKPSDEQQRSDLGGYTEEEIIAHAKEAVRLAEEKKKASESSDNTKDVK